jgi:hypothetical protein
MKPGDLRRFRTNSQTRSVGVQGKSFMIVAIGNNVGENVDYGHGNYYTTKFIVEDSIKGPWMADFVIDNSDPL